MKEQKLMLLNSLISEEKELKNKLEENRAQQRDIYLSEYLNKYGFALGDVIEYKDRDKIIIGKIIKAEYSSFNNEVNNIIISLKKKDGTFGKEKIVWSREIESAIKTTVV